MVLFLTGIIESPATPKCPG